MDIKNTIPITELRKKLFQIVENIDKTGVHYMITEKGKPKAVIMSAEEYDSWTETLEVMKEFPDLDNEIKEFESDVKSGKYKTYPTLEEVINKHTLILADKSTTFNPACRGCGQLLVVQISNQLPWRRKRSNSSAVKRLCTATKDWPLVIDRRAAAPESRLEFNS